MFETILINPVLDILIIVIGSNCFISNSFYVFEPINYINIKYL